MWPVMPVPTARYNYACYNFEGFGVWRSNLKECHEGNCHQHAPIERSEKSECPMKSRGSYSQKLINFATFLFPSISVG
jgi:hypothetical protein